jgi:DNA-binding GntR family transcriptional regulator
MSYKDTYIEAYLNGTAFQDPAGVLSVTDRLIRDLRVAVMRGDLRPGQKLRESELCRDYAASRATVREALRILESERLVELIPNRGPFVAKLGIVEIEEIHDVWAMLTGEAVYRFAERCKSEDLTQLEGCINDLHDAVDAEAPIAQLEATNKFFYCILKKAANRILQEFTVALVSRLMFLRAQSLKHQGWGLLYVEEIEDIVEAIRLRSPEDAKAATRRHIASACAAAKQVSVTPERSVKAAKAPPIAPDGKTTRSRLARDKVT